MRPLPPSPCVWDTSAVVSHGCSDRQLQLSKAVTESQCWQGAGKWDGTGTCRQKSVAAATALVSDWTAELAMGRKCAGRGHIRKTMLCNCYCAGQWLWATVLARGRKWDRSGIGHMIEVDIFRAATSPGSAKDPVLARAGSETGRATYGQKSGAATTASGSFWERVSSRDRKWNLLGNFPARRWCIFKFSRWWTRASVGNRQGWDLRIRTEKWWCIIHRAWNCQC